MAKQIPLTQVPDNQPVRVVSVQGGHGILGRLQALGIRPGVKISKVVESLGRGPLVVCVGGSQTALGRGICSRIIVEVAE